MIDVIWRIMEWFFIQKNVHLDGDDFEESAMKSHYLPWASNKKQ